MKRYQNATRGPSAENAADQRQQRELRGFGGGGRFDAETSLEREDS